MINLKKLLTGSALAFSAIFYSQGTFTNLPSNYNTASSEAAPEKLLSAKELVDIKLNAMMNDPVLRNANWGFVVYDPKTKKVISSYNEHASLIPASTTKLLTTDTAMSMLGEDFRWITQLEYSGEIDANGVLQGNLHIIGSGDPSLGTNKGGAYAYRQIIADFAGAIADRGIKKVAGDIIIQTALFKVNKNQNLPENIVWLENGNYYLPAGTTYEINPKNEKLVARQKNPFSDHRSYYYISPYIQKIVYADRFEGGYLTSKLPDAPAYLANNLRTTLVKSGLPVTGKVVTRTADPNPEKRTVITRYESPTLAEIIGYTNLHSDNALSEAMLRMVGFQKYGDQTLESGRNAVMSHLRAVSFDTDGLNYFDGSGLSRNNVVTPISQVKFLANLMNENYYRTFRNTLPVGGQTGTLRRTFNTVGNGQIFAKTGTLNRVKTLAGYMETNTGRTLVFSLLINNYSGSVDQVKSRMEQILEPALQL